MSEEEEVLLVACLSAMSSRPNGGRSSTTSFGIAQDRLGALLSFVRLRINLEEGKPSTRNSPILEFSLSERAAFAHAREFENSRQFFLCSTFFLLPKRKCDQPRAGSPLPEIESHHDMPALSCHSKKPAVSGAGACSPRTVLQVTYRSRQ